ncbi:MULTISPECIES: ATP-dependent protease LonB [Clostridium]|uniref:endopeptidase La n=2 Tax=Clostridium TaxID=1485 RepID=A0A151ANN9_9CLOT|nr:MULTISPECIES: ATP-dependent protease LonB [Clostridium]KYH29243.1 Lon protease 2 [Clostridium colicanis DSM 13634]MBE6042939.1 ATP-dependent protease LonB [Clostridium thermopalmarium]PRR71042.1 Lon protease 2 [Clostridium thermopalmarium DSM 5974]PVZ23619.1 Lon-like ATP-dependent protease [Clostridium thermopalmarium DSM 5974]
MAGSILSIISLGVTIIMGMYFFNALKEQNSSKTILNRESRKEMEKLKRMESFKLTEPLTEKSRPTSFEEIIGQEKGIKALKAAICGPNPQHVIIYGPPGVGKTAAARLVLEYAKRKSFSPFKEDSKFVEIDATTLRFDDRGIADPLIGSVHDPIYQGAGPLGSAGIPQPKPGAVTKAHGGILFIDEIGELHPIEMNKLLKVMEDRKVFLESAYYNSEDPNIPAYIKEVFDKGLPADFRLIGATTRSPEEICPAIRSRCVEIYFRPLLGEEIEIIAQNAVDKIGFKIEEKAKKLVGKYANNGRDAVNLIQLASGIALNEERDLIKIEDIEWVIENGQYSPRPEKTVPEEPQIGYVNGLAVYAANMGIVMEIEASATKTIEGKGKLIITGIIEEEEISSINKKITRKSTVRSSIENVLTVLKNIFGINCDDYDIHVNFPGGMPVDGPSAGISMVTAVYSAIMGIPVDNKVAMTGEISLHGMVKPVGGVNAKISAAKKAGANTIIIPKENWQDRFKDEKDVKIIPVRYIKDVIDAALLKEIKKEEKEGAVIEVNPKIDVLTAESVMN